MNSSHQVPPVAPPHSSPPGLKQSRLYQEDAVQYSGSGTAEIGIVMRCWQDETMSLNPEGPHAEHCIQAPERGEVGLTLFPSGRYITVPEVDVTLLDRSFQFGDYCKKQVHDEMSGVITDVTVKARLKHVITGEGVGWRDVNELEPSVELDIGGFVTYDDWVGQVLEVFDEAVVELPSGQLVRLPELGSHLSVGDKGQDVLPDDEFLLSPCGHSLKTGNETVVALQHTVVAICWLAINQSLDPQVAQSRSRPQQFWCGDEISKLTVFRGRSDSYVRVGDKATFKDPTGLPISTHGPDPDNQVTILTFAVTQTQTEVNILWQDGSKEHLSSSRVIPYLNPDEYDCWPGDHVIWTDEDRKRAAVVQSVSDRTAILLLDGNSTELVSVLELDAHGSSFFADPQLGMELGVHRGDIVFIHHHDTNGHAPPMVPHIGETERWATDFPMSDPITGWRKVMADIGLSFATRQNYPDFPSFRLNQRPTADDKFNWFGEVVDLRLDGSIVVSHLGGFIAVYPIDQLSRLKDAIELVDGGVWDGHSEDGSDLCAEEPDSWHSLSEFWCDPHTSNGDFEVGQDDKIDDNEIEDTTSTAAIHIDIPLAAPPPLTQEDTQGTPPPPSVSSPATPIPNDCVEDIAPYKRFDILSSVPPDHAFYDTLPSQPSKAFVGRLNREYRALMNGLPASLIVRAYEDRSDLLRSLIIGPENTPYEDAPFVIDWMLGSNYPTSPPIAHFHSWTLGNGRVNPNLYEDGKVCLSILGTWEGDQTENWNPKQSSLYQALVSIQGLVLVKEPWFCEPAYDKLRGTEDAVVNSRLYNEKAYILSRGFICHALECPVGSLEDEVQDLYLTRNRLNKAILDGQALIDRSQAHGGAAEIDMNAAVPRLSSGGIISLSRVLRRLQNVLSISPTTIA